MRLQLVWVCLVPNALVSALNLQRIPILGSIVSMAYGSCTPASLHACPKHFVAKHFAAIDAALVSSLPDTNVHLLLDCLEALMACPKLKIRAIHLDTKEVLLRNTQRYSTVLSAFLTHFPVESVQLKHVKAADGTMQSLLSIIADTKTLTKHIY